MKILEKLKAMVIDPNAHMKLTFGLAVSLVIAIVGATWVVAVNFSKINNSIEKNTELILYHDDDIEDVTTDIETLQNDNVVLKISVAEINTKLTYINKSQIEIIQLLTED